MKRTLAVSDAFYAEVSRLPETRELYEAQRTIFRDWRNDPRFKRFWAVLDNLLARPFEQVQKWSTANAALQGLEGYEFDAFRQQREFDRRQAEDHAP